MTKKNLGRVLVTGSDGFIGSHLTERLVDLGYETTALCIYNSDSKLGWLEELASKKPKNLTIKLGDVRDPFQMQSVIEGINTVYHLASLIAIPYSYDAPKSYVDTNVIGTLNVIQAAKNAKVKRLIHTSTSEVYGTALYVPIDEKHPLQGQSPYSASKIAADMMVESFYRSFDCPFVTLRPFNTFGPRQSYRAVIPTVIGQIVAGSREISLGSISPTRDFNFVENTVDAFLELGFADENVLGKTYNAGSGREISIKDLVTLIGELMGVKVEVKCENERLRPEKSEVERLLADSSLLINSTSWKPQFSLEDGLIKTIEWQSKNFAKNKVLNFQK